MHLAARMEQLATPGSILLTATTLRLVEGLVQVRAACPGTYSCRAAWQSQWRCSSWIGAIQSAVACRLPWRGADSALWGGRRNSTPSATPRSGRGRGMARWWRWSARPVWASRAWCTSLYLHRTRAWLVLESAFWSPMARPLPYFPVSRPAQALYPRRGARRHLHHSR